MPRVARPNKPLADVNVLPQQDGSSEVVVCFMPDPDTLVGEGESRAVLALDASRSIKNMFGGASLFDTKPNYVQAVARKIGEILCNVSRSGKVHLLYWALGAGGAGTELIGELNAEACTKAQITGPSKKNWGTGTQLLPPVRHIVEAVAAQSDFTMGVLITDGIVEDFDAVVKYCYKVGEDIVAGRRKTIKLVLIGVGDEIDEEQLSNLNDMFEPTPLKGKVDLWATGIAADIQEEADIIAILFGELMREEDIIASTGRVVSNGATLKTFADGLPGKFRFSLPKGCTEFTVQVPNHDDVTQPRRRHPGRERGAGLRRPVTRSGPWTRPPAPGASSCPPRCSPASSARCTCGPTGTASTSSSPSGSRSWTGRGRSAGAPASPWTPAPP
jgi:hypothetical protein